MWGEGKEVTGVIIRRIWKESSCKMELLDYGGWPPITEEEIKYP